MSETFADAIDACTDKGVTERPPQAGKHYKAFAVHPRKLGPTTLAIGHREGEMRILDLLRDGLTVAQAAELVKAYGVNTVTLATNDDGLAKAHATLGVRNEL